MDDLISRQAAIEAILQRLDALKGLSFGTSTFRDGLADGYARIMSDLRYLPSAEPKRKMGRWIRNDNGTYSCSICHSWIPEEQHYYARYCLYCGARMKGETMKDLERMSLQKVLDDIQEQVWVGYLELDDDDPANDYLETALAIIRETKEKLKCSTKD